MPWGQTTHPKIAMPMTAASVAQRRMGLKVSIWDNEGVPSALVSNEFSRGLWPSKLRGKCQQENAYGQCLPKAFKPELNTRRVHNPAPLQ